MRQKDFQGKVVTATIPNTAIALVLLLLKQEVFADQGVGLWCDDAFVHFGFFSILFHLCFTYRISLKPMHTVYFLDLKNPFSYSCYCRWFKDKPWTTNVTLPVRWLKILRMTDCSHLQLLLYHLTSDDTDPSDHQHTRDNMIQLFKKLISEFCLS